MTVAKPEKLVAEIKKHEEALKTKKALLEKARKVCKHRWIIVYIPEIEPGYYERGTWNSWTECYNRIWIPDKVTPKWRRTCKCCLKEEETTKTKADTIKGTIPGTEFTGKVPVF